MRRRTRTRRARARARVLQDQEVANFFASDRRPPGDVEITLPNPSHKVTVYLGAPVSVRNFTADGAKQRECVFRLPVDWKPVDEHEQYGEHVVARQDGTPRCVVVEHPEGPVSMSTVLG